MKNNMKNNLKNTILAALLLISLNITTSSNAQVGIGVTTANMAASAELDVTSTTKGFLPPRMNTVQRNAIVNPGAGLIIYCTDCGSNGEIQYYNGTNWMSTSMGEGMSPNYISTLAISNLAGNTATCGGNISADGNANIVTRGVCWSTSSSPNISLSTKTTDGTTTGSYTSAIIGLSPDTTYYVRSYATNAYYTVYGNEVVFTTLQIPSFSTSTISNISYSTATCEGNIISDGNQTVTERGVCWSTSPSPTVALSTKTADGMGIGSYTSAISGLTDNTTYYVRTYATNATGTAYGNEVVFTTLPSISTSSISNLTSNTASCGGIISTSGNGTVSARGVCWSTNSSPTVSLITKTLDNNGAGSYTSVITGLTDNTKYYVRSYATNASGTAYGNEVVFTTNLSPESVSTSTISNLAITSATCGGIVSSSGNGTISARGVCWSISPNPTVALSTKTVNGAGTGNFASAITGLADNTTYYLRSYATNAAGTVYGNEVVLTTIFDSVPHVTIGAQIWTTLNLDVSSYRNGDVIPEVTDPTQWAALTTGAWCYYNNSSGNAATYGKLYNWYAVTDPRGLAPIGYHIPTIEEFSFVTNLKSPCGFMGLAGGERYAGHSRFLNMDFAGNWWSSTSDGPTTAMYRYLIYPTSFVNSWQHEKQYGHSVRCIRD